MIRMKLCTLPVGRDVVELNHYLYHTGGLTESCPIPSCDRELDVLSITTKVKGNLRSFCA